MVKIYKYQKVTDQYTTHTLMEPDYERSENEDRITELCNINNETYVSVPDSIELPDQPEIIAKTLTLVTLDDNLKKQIRKASVHVQLIDSRVVDKIREQYPVNDEFKALRLNDTEYKVYIEECVTWGNDKKAKLGL